MAGQQIFDYITWPQNLGLRWIQGSNAKAWLASVGAALNDQRNQLVTGIKCRFPTQAPVDALPFIGDERGLDRGPPWLENDAQYALRLRKVWNIYPFAGQAPALLYGLYWAGFWGGNYATGNAAGACAIITQNGSVHQLTGLSNLDDPTVNYSLTQANQNISVNQLGPVVNTATGHNGGLPLNQAWWVQDSSPAAMLPSDIGYTSRFAILYPGPFTAPNSPFVNAQLLTFTGSENGGTVPWPTATWVNPFVDTTYAVSVGAQYPTSGGGTMFSVTGKTSTTCQLQPGAAGWAGTVEILAYEQGANPFANLTQLNLARIRRAIKRWRPAKATCTGIYLLAQGNFLGWPVRKLSQMNNAQNQLGSSTVVRYTA